MATTLESESDMLLGFMMGDGMYRSVRHVGSSVDVCTSVDEEIDGDTGGILMTLWGLDILAPLPEFREDTKYARRCAMTSLSVEGDVLSLVVRWDEMISLNLLVIELLAVDVDCFPSELEWWVWDIFISYVLG
jgi:hypothetical protein